MADDNVKFTVNTCRKYYVQGDTKSYDAKKRSLPMACYMCTFEPNEGGDSKHPKPKDTWRLQKAARLNGLIMHDFDKLSKKGIDRNELWKLLPNHWFDEHTCSTAILMAHWTPSGDGLRLVTIANPDLDIEQNQQALLTKIKALNPSAFAALETDESCINADRGSFVVDADSMLFLNESIFTYDNPKYDDKFGEKYRIGSVTGTSKRAGKRVVSLQKNVSHPVQQQPQSVHESVAQAATEGGKSEMDGGLGSVEKNYPDSYHDVEYNKILDTWFEQNGGRPQQGDRHKTLLRLIADLRYICDNNAGFILSVLMREQFIRDWVNDDGAGRELEDMISSSISKELWWGTPKRLKAALDALGVRLENQRRRDSITEEEERQIFDNYWRRLEPLIADPYTPACQMVSDSNKLAAIFAAGTMYCTLMTRTWYEHYDGQPTRLNPTAFIIGMPASGKSFADKFDTNIMACMRAADEPGRKAEKEYKRKQKERASSSKAQKGDPLELPTEMIRYLPSKTSNSVFFRRAENAYEVIDGEKVHLHLYMFDSELDSAVGAQKSDWAGKHDLELKAFHNERSGVDFANNDSVNDILTVYWNQVITGTPVSLHKKFNMRNINDGFCTRVAIVKMWPEKYKMMLRGCRSANHELEVSLKEWGYRFDTMRGELKIGKLVDHVYNLCAEFAEEAGERHDDVLDLLRKRAAYYAIWFTIPRIFGRQWEHYRETGEYEVDDNDLKFASVIFEAVIFWQDYYFGRMLDESWQNAENEVQPRRRNSKASEEYAKLPKEFTAEDVAKLCDLEPASAKVRVNRWMRAGYVSLKNNTRPAVYEKIVNEVMLC